MKTAIFQKGMVIIFLTIIWTLWGFNNKVPPPDWDADTPVNEVLKYLGAPVDTYKPDNINDQTIRQGREIVKKGRTIGPDGNKSKYVSKYYNCNSCHNTVIEDPNLRKSDPEARLEYAEKNNLPFLQGTTFYGIVNRESWYNGDYVKKYGEMAEEAHEDIRKAVQLCATDCSQGRYLEQWELDAIMAYFWSLQFTLGDLGLTEVDFRKLKEQAGDPGNHQELARWLKDFYMDYSPATFVEVPGNTREGYGYEGDPETGRTIYEQSCQHCHRPGGESEYVMDQSIFTFRNLEKNMYDVYSMIRHGSSPMPGHKPYMPLYTEERMSDKQVEDLRAYIEAKAKQTLSLEGGD